MQTKRKSILKQNQYACHSTITKQPLYQNEQMLSRGGRASEQSTMDHDYAPINGAGRSNGHQHSTSPIYEGIYRKTTTTNSNNDNDNDVDLITEKISMINNLLDDLDAAARSSYVSRNGSKSPSPLSSNNHVNRLQTNSNAGMLFALFDLFAYLLKCPFMVTATQSLYIVEMNAHTNDDCCMYYLPAYHSFCPKWSSLHDSVGSLRPKTV